MANLCHFCQHKGASLISIEENIANLGGKTVASFLGPLICPAEKHSKENTAKTDYPPSSICDKCLLIATSFYNFIELCNSTNNEPLKRACGQSEVDRTSANVNLSHLMPAVTGLTNTLKQQEETKAETSRSISVSHDETEIQSPQSISGTNNEPADLTNLASETLTEVSPKVAENDIITNDCDNFQVSNVDLENNDCQNFVQVTLELPLLGQNSEFDQRENHIKNREIEIHCICEVCGAAISLENNLQMHLSEAHGIGNVKKESKMFLCNHCGKVLKSKLSLTRHEKTHKGILDYICADCNLKFVTRTGLVAHTRQHLGKLGKYVCDKCPKKYRNVSSLKRHKLWHTGNKEFQCEQCNESFYTIFELRSHLNRKHVQILHECSICSKVLTTALGLRRHIMVHKNIRPFRCSLCDKSFIGNERLKRHMKLIHKIHTQNGSIWKDPKTYFSLEKLLEM